MFMSLDLFKLIRATAASTTAMHDGGVCGCDDDGRSWIVVSNVAAPQ